MAWNAQWPNSTPQELQQFKQQPPKSWSEMTQDELLMLWQQKKDVLAAAKEAEMELRKYIVARAFPDPNEGVNTQDLGNGYQLKAKVAYNYKLDAPNEKIEDALNRIAKVNNEGSFIADRLVSWTPNFLLTEYRALQDAADNGSNDAKTILKIIGEVLTITDAAPTLEIKEPKAKKK